MKRKSKRIFNKKKCLTKKNNIKKKKKKNKNKNKFIYMKGG